MPLFPSLGAMKTLLFTKRNFADMIKLKILSWKDCCCCSVTLRVQPMDFSSPGFPVHHHLLEFVQTHVHQVSAAIQPSHPLSSPSPPAFSLSQHQGLFQCVSSSHQVVKVLEFQLQHHPSNEHPGLISFRMDWLDLLAVQGTLKSLLQHHNSKASILQHSAFFTVQLSHAYTTTGKTIALHMDYICVHAKSLQSCLTLCDPKDCSRQAPPPTGFSRKEHWRGLPCPPPGGLPDPGLEPASLMSAALAGRFFTTSAAWEAADYIHTPTKDAVMSPSPAQKPHRSRSKSPCELGLAPGAVCALSHRRSQTGPMRWRWQQEFPRPCLHTCCVPVTPMHTRPIGSSPRGTLTLRGPRSSQKQMPSGD